MGKQKKPARSGVGLKIQALRISASLTQPELAEKCGIPTGTLRHWEQGVNDPKWDQLLPLVDALADALAVTPATILARLYTGPEERQPIGALPRGPSS